MEMTSIRRWLSAIFIALALGAVAASSTLAEPYDGVNRIGTFYQYSNTYQYGGGYGYTGYGHNTFSSPYTGGYQNYQYAFPARAGGFFGSGTEYILGLREPYWANVAPVHYTHYSQAVCSWPCWFGGGYGYPRNTANSYAYRTRYSGGYGYY